MSQAALSFLKLVPKNALSRTVGAALRGPWPASVHQATIRWFIRRYGVDVSEAAQPVESYRTFAEFFTRELAPGARPVAAGDDVLVSPSDGTLGASGPIEDGLLLQAKGRPYSLEAFVGDAERARVHLGGHFVTIYLAPFDYHRVHFPISGRISGAVHVPGHLWPVNPAAVERIEDLFAINERLLTLLDTDSGPVTVAMVGATNVGRMSLRFDELTTNAGRHHGRRRYDPPRTARKGDELGMFGMGSTVILLLPPGFEPGDLVPGRKIRMGQTLGTLK